MRCSVEDGGSLWEGGRVGEWLDGRTDGSTHRVPACHPPTIPLARLTLPIYFPSSMTAAAETRDRLRQAKFLEGITDSALHQLAKLVTSRTFECDDVLF